MPSEETLSLFRVRLIKAIDKIIQSNGFDEGGKFDITWHSDASAAMADGAIAVLRGCALTEEAHRD